MVIDHVSNLSSSRIDFVLELPALQPDSPFERGVEDDLSPRRRNPRIKHFEIKEVSAPFN